MKTKQGNLLELAVEAAKVRASLGEISDACEATLAAFRPWGSSTGAGRIGLTRAQKYKIITTYQIFQLFFIIKKFVLPLLFKLYKPFFL